jgi:DNA-binding response OmpR family regulator
MIRRQTEVRPGHEMGRDASQAPTIFLVDDGTLMAEIVERKLGQYGFRVVLYRDPLRVVDNLQKEKPAAVFVDLETQEMDAVELAIMARRRGYNGHLVMVSASRDRERIASAIRAGANDILSKPVRDFELDLIVEKIRSARTRSKPILESLKTILQTVEQGVILLDKSRRTLFANACANEIMQVEPNADVASLIERNCPDSIFEQCREGGPAATFLDLSHPGRDRRVLVGLEVFYLDTLLTEPCYLILMRDFSRWRKLDELHSRFATYLSHQMRTPLTSVRNSVKILSDECGCLRAEERERLLDIGWRNVEKLIASLDELQKIFMIESEELSVSRTLVKVRKELRPLLEEIEREGRIRGFKIRIPDLTIVTGRARLRDFISSAVEAYNKWVGDAPYIECISSIREDFKRLGGVSRRLKITIRARPGAGPGHETMSVRDFLSFEEAHLGLVLNRLATVLEGEVEIGGQNSISILIPMDPPFDREKDLVHNLHSMTEKAELTGAELHLVELKMIGVTDGGVHFLGMLEESLCAALSGYGIASKGEEPFSYSLFILNKTRDELTAFMNGIRDRFTRLCCERGEELYPSIRWDIKYSRRCGADSGASLVEEMV